MGYDVPTASLPEMRPARLQRMLATPPKAWRILIGLRSGHAGWGGKTFLAVVSGIDLLVEEVVIVVAGVSMLV